jgi:hypothetical protein
MVPDSEAIAADSEPFLELLGDQAVYLSSYPFLPADAE